MNEQKSDPVKTLSGISVGFIIVFVITGWDGAIFISLIAGLAGIFSPWLSRKIDFAWTKLTWLPRIIVPNLLLGMVFYLILFPVALLSKVFRRNAPLTLKNNSDSFFRIRNKPFEKESFEKPW